VCRVRNPADAELSDNRIILGIMDQLTVALGQVIARRRLARGYSWRMLADRSGVSANTVRNLERGVRSARINIAARIAMGLGVPLSRLVRQAERQRARKRNLAPVTDAAGRVGRVQQTY
jgi:transcriptional regulator with XRE-family HTH domain